MFSFVTVSLSAAVSVLISQGINSKSKSQGIVQKFGTKPKFVSFKYLIYVKKESIKKGDLIHVGFSIVKEFDWF